MSKKCIKIVLIIVISLIVALGVIISGVFSKNGKQGSVNTSISESYTVLKIPKSEITTTAKFYPYKASDTYMEVLAVKASDGTIRTSFNTCQVCYSSGKGYYKQEGNELVCQNCGNRFNINQIEKIKNGCNPVPILESDKKDDGTNIVIAGDYLNKNKKYFSDWKKE